MKQIGIKLADGTFYPILNEGTAETKTLNLTTVQDNQTTVHVDLYRSESGSMDDAEYVDTLEIKQLNPHENGEPTLNLEISLDEKNELSAKINDPETGKNGETQVTLVSRTLLDRNSEPVNFNLDNVEPSLPEEPVEADTSSVDAFDNTIANDLPVFEEPVSDETAVSDEDLADFNEEEISVPVTEEDKTADSESDVGLSAADAALIAGGAALAGAGAYALASDKKDDESEPSVTDEEPSEPVEEEIDVPVAEENNDFEIPADILNDLPSQDEEVSESEDESIDGVSLSMDELDVLGVGDNEKVDTAETAEEESAVIGPSPNDEDFSFDDVNEESQVSVDEAEPVKEETSDDFDFDSISESDPSLVESEVTDTVSDEAAVEETPVYTSADTSADDFSLPDFDAPEETSVSVEDSVPEETAAADDSVQTDDTFVTDEAPAAEDFSLPDFDAPEETAAENVAEEEVSIEETPVSEEPAAEDSTFADTSADDFSLPDFDSPEETSVSVEDSVPEETFAADDTVQSDDTFVSDDVPAEEDFSLPDFDDSTDEQEAVAAASASAVGLSGVFDEDFGEPNLSTEDEFNTSSLDDDMYKTKDPTFQPNNNMFSDLYDKETLEGKSTYNSDYEDSDEIKKKTRVPVIICIVCAIICIIGALLVLFVIPSKINIFNKTKASEKETAVETPAEVETEEEPVADLSQSVVIEVVPPVEKTPEPEAVPEPAEPAKENEIVVVKEPEVVVPAVPKADKKKEPVTYKIKWGDTLWDIANAYYKNPWRYKFLARYNGIRNPDKIISGTYIKIPNE
ncbi:MAG: LysM peptidoglycan-binding domain-containing protein [Treponema sp.]|nr:LysM peptidoglycan-binding domain-containing protein [Treponema sp.]